MSRGGKPTTRGVAWPRGSTYAKVANKEPPQKPHGDIVEALHIFRMAVLAQHNFLPLPCLSSRITTALKPRGRILTSAPCAPCAPLSPCPSLSISLHLSPSGDNGNAAKTWQIPAWRLGHVGGRTKIAPVNRFLSPGIRLDALTENPNHANHPIPRVGASSRWETGLMMTGGRRCPSTR